MHFYAGGKKFTNKKGLFYAKFFEFEEFSIEPFFCSSIQPQHTVSGPPDFGRSENGGGSAGAPHYYLPPQIFRPSAIPGQDRNPRLSFQCIRKVNQIIIRYAFYTVLHLGFRVGSKRHVLLNEGFYQEVLLFRMNFLNECVY